MRAIDVRCPVCGGALRVDDEAVWVDCEYCGTRSRLQAQSRQLEAVRPPAAPRVQVPAPSPSPSVDAGWEDRRPPAGTAKAARRIGCAVFLVPIGIVVAVLGFVFYTKRTIENQTQWQGTGGAILRDLDGDGSPEVIGRARSVLRGDRVTIAAYDGRSGKRRWESEALGTYSETYQGKLALVGDTLIYASPLGGLRGFAVADGKARWQVPLGEEVKAICRTATGDARVTTTDGEARAVRVADGQPAEAEAGGEAGDCAPVAHDGDGGDPSLRVVEKRTRDVEVPGMSWKQRLEHGDGPPIVLGNRAKGTTVPMAAALAADPAMRWATELAERPLEAGTFTPEHAALTDDRLFVVVGLRDIMKPAHLVAVDRARGTRLWEVSLGRRSPVEGVLATPDRVYVSSWGTLEAFDPATGQRLYTIGVPW
jgi:putative pyrroloquinoline-quinone binding quinoprotein